MKKIFIFFCMLIIVFGIVANLQSSSDYLGSTSSFKSVTSTQVTFNDITPTEQDHLEIPEPAILLLIGSGLIGFATFGRKRFKN